MRTVVRLLRALAWSTAAGYLLLGGLVCLSSASVALLSGEGHDAAVIGAVGGAMIGLVLGAWLVDAWALPEPPRAMRDLSDATAGLAWWLPTGPLRDAADRCVREGDKIVEASRRVGWSQPAYDALACRHAVVQALTEEQALAEHLLGEPREDLDSAEALLVALREARGRA